MEHLEWMNSLSHRFCIAPMMDWTDRHCRFFLRLITRRARLYTEMITAPALVHGDVAPLLPFVIYFFHPHSKVPRIEVSHILLAGVEGRPRALP